MTRRRGGRAAPRGMALLLVVWLTGCAGSGGGGGTPPPNPSGTVSYKSNIQPVFNRSCAITGCHRPPTSAQQLDLTKNVSYGQLVNVASTEQPSVLRVAPGDPDASYLIRKIEGTPGISGGQMPVGCPGTVACLSGDQMDMFRTWVTEGALNN